MAEGRVPPPSFSSFPDVQPAKQLAPAFSSFPSPPRPARADAGPPAKRSKADHFLDDLSRSLDLTRGDARSLDERRRRDEHRPSSSSRRRNDKDENRPRTSRGNHAIEQEQTKDVHKQHRHRTSRDEPSERRRDREHHSYRDDESQRSHDSRRHRDKGKARATNRELDAEKDSDYGPRRAKPYQLVQAPQGGDTDAALDALARRRTTTDDSPTDKPLFFESRRGDENNLRYGGLHRGDVPKYYRLGGGRVLGLNEGMRIARETAYSGRGVEIAPLNRFRTPRYTDSASYRHLTDKNTKRVVLRPRSAPQQSDEATTAPLDVIPPEDAGEEYVAFDRERTTTEKLGRLEHEEGTDYRSLAGLIKPGDLGGSSESEDDLFSSLGISGGESHAERLRRKNVELDRALRENPRDVPRWLEFVELQDEIAQSTYTGGGGSSAKRALSKGERASTSEVKLAILVRALAVPENADAELLILAQLHAAAEVEEPQRVLSRWKTALRDHPRLTGLWIEYVSWRQTTWVTFNVKDLVHVFEESLEVLVDAMDREDPDSAAREMLESNAVYLFLRLCLMLRQAGFAERALAAFQGLVELNIFRPRALDRLQYERTMPWRERIFAAFESFWEGEAPRIGESGARGWAATSEDDLAPECAPRESAGVLIDLGPDARAFERWASAERAAAAAASRPARASDPEMDSSDDPYRVVLFDDIKPFLFLLSSAESRQQLAYAFLAFLGLPFVPPDVPTSTPFTTDPFVHSELVERPNLISRFWPPPASPTPYGIVGGEAMEPERSTALKAPWATPFRAMPATVDSLFAAARPGWFRTLGKEDLQDIDVELARNVLASLRQALPADTFLTLDAFSLEAVQSSKAAVKLAKQVLGDQRNNLALWDGYARIERQRGKAVDARQVYCTALSMYRSFNATDQIDGPLLWRAWAEMEWEEGRPIVALKVLTAAAITEDFDLASLATADPDVRPSAPQAVRARQHYTRELEAAFQPRATQALVRNRNHLAFSFALLQYLTLGLAAAVDVLEHHLFRLDSVGASGSAEHEEALVMYAKLLFRHSSQGGGYRPAQLRELLERAISQYKNNSLFLALFYFNEQRMKIENHFRRLMEETVLRDAEVTSEGWLFAIFAELHRNARSTNVWAVRNLFDRAIDNPRTRPSASIWTLYIDFEVRNGEAGRAKSLIYRAIRECPWCKELYLRPFSPTLRSVFRSRELRDFHHLLLEKGLRVHVDVDAYLEHDAQSDMEVDDEADDVEQLERLEEAGEEVLTERTRLMPY